MQKRRRKGEKNEHGLDFPMEIKTNRWEIPTNSDICELIDTILDNEERIYPRRKNFIGNSMFIQELNKVLEKYGYEIGNSGSVTPWM